MIKRIHHVGAVVQDLAGGYAFWRDTLGLPVIREAEVKDQGVRAALLACGACEVELLEPTAPDTPVGRFLEKKGEGLHHVCFESDDVGRDVHPRSCAGILVELATPAIETPAPPAPLTATVVHAIVEHVQEAAHLYRNLFGLPIRISHPDWSLAQLAAGDVALQLSSTTTTSGKPGLSMLRLMTRDLAGVADRLQAAKLAFRRDAVGLVLGPAPTRGVPLIIHQPQS
jgi:methylmalonyl-CoA/ethylmalonyl-CoA epimerase